MTNTPKLRFDGFNEVWGWKKGSSLFSILGGAAFSSKDSSDEGIKWYKIANVGINKTDKKEVSYLPITILEEYRRYVLNKGDITLALTRPILNSRLKICIIDDFFDGSLLNQRVGKLIIKDEVDRKFIYYLLQTKGNIRYLENMIAGTDPPNLSNNDLLKKKYNVPNRAEQEKIASFFSLIDKKIELQTEKVEELKSYKKGIMQKIFSQELRFKDENGNDYPKWEDKKLDEIGTCVSGVGFSDKYQGYLNLPIKVFKVSDMNNQGNQKFMIHANNTVSEELLKQMKTKSIKNPSIIFAKVGAAIFLERKRIVNSEFIIDNNMMAFIPNPSNDIEFMYYLLSNMRLSRYAQVGALPSYNASDISHIKSRIPSFKEQVKIAKVLSKIDKKLEKEQEKLDYLTQYKKGLLQQMFI